MLAEHLKLLVNMAVNKNVFQKAVEITPEISNAYCSGLQALGANSTKVILADARLVNGSVDIDSATHSLYPNEARWDYAVGYSGKVYFIEVHPANTSNVKEMLAKTKWLIRWLQTKAPKIKELMAVESYYWVASGECKISPNSPQYRQLAQSHIVFKGKRVKLQ